MSQWAYAIVINMSDEDEGYVRKGKMRKASIENTDSESESSSDSEE